MATQYSQFLAQDGHFIASDQLTPFITRVRQLLNKYAGRQDWNEVQVALGNALLMIGNQTGTDQLLEDAIAAYCSTLTEWTRERAPLEWARTQSNLGRVLRTLGERELGTARLEDAVATHHEALKEYTRKRVPLEWARIQNNLGIALRTLGERELGTARLEDAVAAHRAALTERTRERVPLDWAWTQTNLGEALRALGMRRKDASLICEALGKHLLAWEVSVIGSPYDTTRVANYAKSTIAALKDAFDSSIYEACMAQHAEDLKRIGLFSASTAEQTFLEGKKSSAV